MFYRHYIMHMIIYVGERSRNNKVLRDRVMPRCTGGTMIAYGEKQSLLFRAIFYRRRALCMRCGAKAPAREREREGRVWTFFFF